MSAHTHDGHDAAHGHSQGLVHDSIKRSREGLRAVGLALLVLALTAAAQTAVFIASGSVALLADLVHNAGDAATAIPLGIAFALRSARGERLAGLAVVAAIFISPCVAGYEAIAASSTHSPSTISSASPSPWSSCASPGSPGRRSETTVTGDRSAHQPGHLPGRALVCERGFESALLKDHEHRRGRMRERPELPAPESEADVLCRDHSA